MKILIRGEKVYDGTGALPGKKDILVENGKITGVGENLGGNVSGHTAAGDLKIIEAKAVCPGFIDIHRHADAAIFSSADFGKAELLQGITTTVVGNCGMAPVPLDHPWQEEYCRYIEPVVGPLTREFPRGSYRNYREGLEAHALPINIGFFAGAGAVKTAIKGFSKTPFSAEEMKRAQKYIHEALGEGALGLSFGIMYLPECFSGFDELTALARCAAGGNGIQPSILVTHIRGEAEGLVESVDEIIRVAERAGVRLNISHFKATGIKNQRSLIHRAIEKIEAARSRGMEVTADFYPYTAGSTTIMSLVPNSVLENSMAELCIKLSGKAGREELRRELHKEQPGWDNMGISIGWDRIIISSVNLGKHEAYCGRSMEAVAREEGFDDPVDLMGELVAAEEGKVGVILDGMAQEDVDCIARLPWSCLISDSLYNGAANPHPRVYGAFPKFYREYAGERHILSAEEAIKKMTSLPAERMGLKDRGNIRPGCAADILIFDPLKFRDNADYTNSRALSTGIDTIILNGQIVYDKGVFSAPNGRVVHRQ